MLHSWVEVGTDNNYTLLMNWGCLGQIRSMATLSQRTWNGDRGHSSAILSFLPYGFLLGSRVEGQSRQQLSCMPCSTLVVTRLRLVLLVSYCQRQKPSKLENRLVQQTTNEKTENHAEEMTLVRWPTLQWM